MAKFATAAKQSASVIKLVQGTRLQSAGTARNYEQALTRAAEYAKDQRIEGGLRGITPDQAITYLEARGQEVGQKTLDMERQALQMMMQSVTHKLETSEKLPFAVSELKQALHSRAYSPEQVDLIVQSQTKVNSFSTELAHHAGLRAHELITIQKSEHQPADPRPANDTKFLGRDGIHYTVTGKGGLTREVRLSPELSERLEARIIEPQKVVDRGINYIQHYAINGGQKWSNSFSAASNRVLGWSRGAHGMRHSYAQERMDYLQKSGLTRVNALETVSQELGHFRPDITEVYLR